jgi:hypothetical protein
MDGTDTVTVHHQVTGFITMGLAGGRTIESRGQDAFLKHQHTANKSPVAGAPFRNGIGDLQKIGIPVRAHFISSLYELARCNDYNPA